MNDLEDLLTATFDDLGRDAPHTPGLAGRARRTVRRQRVAAALGAGAAAAVVATVALVALDDRGGDERPAARPGCASAVVNAVLPEWARGGFSEAEPRASFVTGDAGRIVAILGGTLSSPPDPVRNNKVLWVASPQAPPDGAPLRITATLEGTDVVARREVATGAGPSILDLPRPGCWRLELAWGGHTDAMGLVYARGG